MENRGIIQSLQNKDLYDHPIVQFEVIETHLSWILLTGYYAYKIKKAIQFPFADFSSLEKRYFYCQEELRLNQRLAPTLYLEVVTIHGSYEHPSVKSSADKSTRDNTIIEYAVKMMQFDQERLLSRLAEKNEISIPIVQSIAYTLSRFHKSAPVCKASSLFGTEIAIQKPMLDNFQDSKKILKKMTEKISEKSFKENINAIMLQLEHLEHKSKEDLLRLTPIINQRKQTGFIRECHGDCHLGNMVLIEDEPVIFDCIEFNPEFRWIDTINEIAFLTMDLQARSTAELTFSFLNTYLELSADYEGLALLSFYQTYRAMVRAKVALLSIPSTLSTLVKPTKQISECMRYLNLAKTFHQKQMPKLIITQGVSGSGKTWLATHLAPEIQAIHLRSDIERKRLSLASDARYKTQNQKRVYQILFNSTQNLLENGFSVIVDATFLRFQDRKQFMNLAMQYNIPFYILHCEASGEVLKQRILSRLLEKKDASEATHAVLEQQLSGLEPLQDLELKYRISGTGNEILTFDKIKERLTVFFK